MAERPGNDNRITGDYHGPEENPRRSGNVARIYSRAGRVFLILLAVFAAFSLVFNSELLNFKNLYLFAHDLSASYDATFAGERDVLTYTANDDSVMLPFRGGLAVVGNRNVAVFTATGRQTLSDDLHLQRPAAVASDTYLLVWDADGTTLRLYNSYTCVYSQTTAFPIEDAYLCEDGHFAIVTRSTDATAVVYLYQNSQRIQNKITRSDYVTGCTISENGKRLAFLTVDAANSVWQSKVAVCRAGDDALRFEVTLEETVAYSCSYSSRGFLFVLTDRGVEVFNRRGKQKRDIPFEVGDLISYAAGPAGIAFLEREEDGGVSLTITNARGRVKRVSGVRDSDSVPEQVEISGKYVFLLEAGGVRRISFSGAREVFVPCDTAGQTLVVCDENNFMLCTGAKAIHYTLQ